jgi:citrate lyase subunit beta / citryl-CoA lyase
MARTIRRSTLILPVNIPRFVEKAYQRGADAILLDLEDAVPLAEKENARRLVKDSLALAAKGGAEVGVRINKDPSMFLKDLEASVYPGLDGITLPKAESAEEVRNLESVIEKLERQRGMKPGHVQISILVETPKGLLKAQEIATASPRIESMFIGPEDYCLELGVEPSPDGTEIFYPLSYIVIVCKPVGIRPMGLVGSIAGFRDLEAFERSVSRARQIGCEGASCIHPDQVAVINRAYTPAQEKVEFARRTVEVFEEGLKKGTSSVNLDGKMVDIPVYNRAKLVMTRAEAIAAVEKRKAEALAKLK